MASSRRDRGDDAVRITTAGSDPQADLARRQRRYLISMSVRALCFIGAVFAGVAGIHWLWPVLILGAVLLPYIAVVQANAADTRDQHLPLTDGGPGHRQLGSHGS